jgi:hypothetical protein
LDDAMGRHSWQHTRRNYDIFSRPIFTNSSITKRAAIVECPTLGRPFSSNFLGPIAWRCRLFSRWLAKNPPNVIYCLYCHREIFQVLVANVGPQLT